MSELQSRLIDTSNWRKTAKLVNYLGRPMKEVLAYDFGQAVPPEGPTANSQIQQEPYDPINWRAYAACKGMTELFFPRDVERPQQRERREARARIICARCPAILDCRDYAKKRGEVGIWGGTTEQERGSKMIV